VRLLLLSDIHANLEALEASLAAAPEHGTVANLGDIVGYGASPNEVTEQSRALGAWFVRGNHDKASTGLMGLEDFNPVAALAATWTQDQLTSSNLEWLRALPLGPACVEGLPGIQLAHGSPLDEDEYVVTVRDATEPLLATSIPVTFIGHTHLQGAFIYDKDVDFYRPEYKTVGKSETCEFKLQEGKRYLVNPGSVGQPRDGDWRAAFAVFDSDTQIVTFCRTPYDLKTAQERILAANLPPRLATRLAAGR
jgi:diadenosine tetraphosphatase ApaH/serine/threonine PP2A family protein phosphatase